MATASVCSQELLLERLHRLNSVIAATGSPLCGNLFYEHHQPDFATRPPARVFEAKRNRFAEACRGGTRLLEVGVNGCHAALLALTVNADLAYHGVDICVHPYVEAAVEWLDREFPGRVQFHRGDSRRVLRTLCAQGLQFDMFHIDGHKAFTFKDLARCSRMVAGQRAVVVIDDTNQLGVQLSVAVLGHLRVLRPLGEFPPPPPSEPEQNGVQALLPSSAVKFPVLAAAGGLLDLGRRAKNRVAPGFGAR